MASEDSSPRVRRIVTGHTPAGDSVLVADEQVSGTTRRDEAGLSESTFLPLWATHSMPVDLGDEAMQKQREGSRAPTVGSGSGSVLRIAVLGPGSRSPMHRTASLDYGICLDGECDLELDGGDVVTLHAGDVVVQRGTNHVWHNRSASPCRFAWILIDAHPAPESVT